MTAQRKKISQFNMLAHSTWHTIFISNMSIIILTILLFQLNILIKDVNGQIEKQPWYETLPAVAMDYKVHLDAGKEDCYYQYVQPGATLYVSFQVNMFEVEMMLNFNFYLIHVLLHICFPSNKLGYSRRRWYGRFRCTSSKR